MRTPDDTPLDKLVARESEVLLQQAILELPEDYREVLLLRTGRGLSFAEVSAILETQEETVRWRVHKARQILLKKLAGHFDRPSSSP